MGAVRPPAPRVAVTGAGGALGSATVRALLARGVPVRALLRGGEAPPGAEAVRLDLADPGADLAGALAGCGAVVHAAAALAGSEATMARDTVEATRRLLAALREAGVPRLVLASSVAVYGAGPPGGTIDESSPLEGEPAARDAYARAKLAQEALVRAAAPPEAWLLRIGHLWGPGRMGSGHLGPALGPVRLVVAGGPLPLCHLDHAALACALAAATEPHGIEALNVLDADLPDAAAWLRAVGGTGLPLPWRLLDGVAGMAGAWAPGLLRRPALRARMMPRRWPVAGLRARLGWTPLGDFAAMAGRRG